MCNRTRELLTSRIHEVLQNLGPSNPVMEEVTRHALFCRDHTHSFQGRADILHAVDKYLSGPDPMMPLVIYGESGVGKTSLMSKIVMETQTKSKERNLAVMYRFCGTTPDSSTGTIVIIYLFSILYSSSPPLTPFRWRSINTPHSPPTNDGGPGSNAGVDAICGLSLMLVLSFAPIFFSGYSGFPLSSKTNIFKFQFDKESGRRRTTLWIRYLQILLIYLYLLILVCSLC